MQHIVYLDLLKSSSNRVHLARDEMINLSQLNHNTPQHPWRCSFLSYLTLREGKGLCKPKRSCPEMQSTDLRILILFFFVLYLIQNNDCRYSNDSCL